DRVQEQYYAPRSREGLREGSVIISTPGDGLDHLDLNELWRDSIAHVNSMGAHAASRVTQLRALIDVASTSAAAEEIWPIIVAAGRGTRAAESGLNVPKPLSIVGKRPAIVQVLRSIEEGLGK